jgi:membrane-bound lytic murein transglycosylase D
MIRKPYLVLALSLLTVVPVARAQTEALNTSGEAATAQQDPIAEMLDSLVTLNNVIRYNALNTPNCESTPGAPGCKAPQFTDEEYRQRIEAISSPIPLTLNDEVRRYIDLYAYKKRGLTARVLGLSDLYFPLFEEILDREQLPEELKYLAIVESALNPIARSRVGATGIWQFMYNTGKLYGLRIDSYIDERRDPIRATEAACQYFKDMYAIYNDWLLVIAAYNCGAGNVNRAIVRSGGQTDFWQISRFLPYETRGYVPAFIAVCYVMKNAAEHRITPVEPAFSYFEVDTMWIDNRTTLHRIADATELPLDVVRYLNPLYKRGVIPDRQGQQLVRLPANRMSAFLAHADQLYAPEKKKEAPVLATLNISNKPPDGYEFVYKKGMKTHRVRWGESLSVIADKYECSISQIKRWNGLSSSRIYSGQRLKVYGWTRSLRKLPPVEETAAADTLQKDTTTALADTAADREMPATGQTENGRDNKASSKFVYHVVQQGDTLWKIAKMYDGATIEQIMELNRITEVRDLKTGTRLKVLVSG